MKSIKVIVVLFLILSLLLPSIAFADESIENKQSTDKISSENEADDSTVNSEHTESESSNLKETQTNEETAVPENETLPAAEEDSLEPAEGQQDSGTLEEPATVAEPDAEEELESSQTEAEATPEIETAPEPKMSTFQAVAGTESSISRLGHIRSSSVKIYKNYTNSADYTAAGEKYTNQSYYVQKQALFNDVKYYLISVERSSTSGVIGWVKATDMSTSPLSEIDSKTKSFIIKGTSNAYDRPWGGSKNIFRVLSGMKGQTFTSTMTEKLGNDLWYRGTIDGVTVWIHERQLTPAEPERAGAESQISRLGHIRSESVRIYKNYTNAAEYTAAGEKYTNQSYYVQKQAIYKDIIYYLISVERSSTSGVVGWVKSTDMRTSALAEIDAKTQNFIINGTSNAYDRPWGGSKNIFRILSEMKGQTFTSTMTEKLGNDLWYRGKIDGVTVWIHERQLTASGSESEISRVGHIKSATVRIYDNYAVQSVYKTAGTEYTNQSYYIQKQAILNKVTYFLVSTEATGTSGVVGWVRAGDMRNAAFSDLDATPKKMYIRGTSNAYDRPWGGSKNIHRVLAGFKGQVFNVTMTQQLGNDLWYRGEFEGKTVWIHEASLAKPGEESSISRLGHVRSESVRIYNNYAISSDYALAGSKNTNESFYIQKQAVLNGVTYYLISRERSSTSGVVGWVKAADLRDAALAEIDPTPITLYIKGTSNAYDRPWGGSKNIFRELSGSKGKAFAVTMTEKLGNDLWYRGQMDGKTVWIHEASLITGEESDISRLGHIRSESVRIYENYAATGKYVEAGQSYTNESYYILKQAKYNGVIYYLISRERSSTAGVAGWVKSTDMKTSELSEIDDTKKTMYIKGTSNAYDRPWGGSKNIYRVLSGYKNQPFTVTMTEKLGNDLWYRGQMDGKTVWIHEASILAGLESNTSRLGHLLNDSIKIYPNYSDQSDYKLAGTTYTHESYYIQKQVLFNGSTYYLISREQSSTTGVVGWVKSTDMKTSALSIVDQTAKTMFIAGTSNAYDKPWGGSKNIHRVLSGYKGETFNVTVTEKLGNDLWYRGVFEGKTVWIHEDALVKTLTTYSKYDITYQQALDRQMSGSPQTDKYRNKNAFVPKSSLNFVETSAIASDGVRLRKTPSTAVSTNIYATVNQGTKVTIRKTVTGTSYQGSTKWYEISYNGQVLYVHSLLVNEQSSIGTAKALTKVYETTSLSSHVYGSFAAGSSVSIVKVHGDWVEVSYNVWRNAKRSDVDEFMNPDNNDPFQHLVLSSSAGVSAAQLNKILAGKGILDGHGQTFIDAGNQYAVNEVYLISHALLETGQGLSALANGVEVGKNSSGEAVLVTASNRSKLTAIKKTYNMFGIRAYDSCALECGAEHAYNAGWFTPEKAIVGGADFIGRDYIHNSYGQDTIYKMRWNHIATWKQYATDVGWASKQVSRIKNIYSLLDNPNYHFDLPQFK